MSSKPASNSFRIFQVKNGLKHKDRPQKAIPAPDTPRHLPKLHCIAGFFGVVRSGKTYALVNLVEDYLKHGCFNMFFLISCTYESNTVLHSIPFEPGGVYTDAASSEASLVPIIGAVQKRKDEHEYEKIYKEAYDIWKADKKHLSLEQCIMLNDEDHREPRNIEFPHACLVIDDMINTPLMANTINNKLSHLCLHHRHIADGAGISIFQCLQKFKSGMPRAVRSNLGVICLFGTCDMTEIEDMWREVANGVSFDTFKKMFMEATKDPHGFLLIDKYADPETMFGINFDRRFYIDPQEERRKVLFGKDPQPKRQKKNEEKEKLD
jgi:hypothetical protein